MTKTNIFAGVLFLVAIGLGYHLFNNIIYSEIRMQREVKFAEGKIIERLKQIRDAEIAFESVNKKYSGDWDSLISFVKTGKIYTLEKTEEIIPQEYGEEVVKVHIDTLGEVTVLDSIFSKYPRFSPDSLPFVPYRPDGKKFDLFAGKVTNQSAMVSVFEVKEPNPSINPKRNEDAVIFAMKPLRVGSRTEATTNGNWE